jgi:hypothetical protein
MDWTPSSTPPNPGLNGTQVRAAYDDGTPAAADGATVATIQLASWDQAALTSYAQSAGLPDPIADKSFHAVNVDGGPDTTAGFDEVALDQEALLGVAPNIRQRAYFGPQNSTTTDGYLDALFKVADDTSLPSVGPHLVALSTSWGFCEDTSAADRGGFAAFEDALSYLTAAGVTIFAGSGDSGSWCPGQSSMKANTVAYPASSPSVIAVGGTTLIPGRPDTSWACGQGCTTSIANDCKKTQGCSGGGTSALFAAPSWQRKVAHFTKRAVPDISAVANENYGYGFYVTAPGDCVGSPTCTTEAGGTSLSGPVSAALLANQLAAHNHPEGVGDLHRVLYAAPARDFHDIADLASNGSYQAVAGYDRVTGLGTVDWKRLIGSVLAEPTPLVATVGRNHRVLLHRGSHLTTLSGSMVGSASVASLHGRDLVFAVGYGSTPYVRTVSSGWKKLTSRKCLALETLVSGQVLIATCETPGRDAVIGLTFLKDRGLPRIGSWFPLHTSVVGAVVPTTLRGGSAVVATNMSGRVEIAPVRSVGKRLVRGGWKVLGYRCGSQPTAVSTPQTFELACPGANGHVQLVRVSPWARNWPHPRDIGGGTYAPVGLTLSPSGASTVYAQSPNGRIRHRDVGPHPSGWRQLSGRGVDGISATLSTAATRLTTAHRTGTTTTLSAGSPALAGVGLTLTATVRPSSVTGGLVSFEDLTTGKMLGISAVTSASASINVPLAAGPRRIVARYSGTSRYATSASAVRTVTVSLQPTVTTLVPAPNPGTAGQPVTLTATVTAVSGIPTGSVTFVADGTTLGVVPLDVSGVAVLTTSALTAGDHSLSADYGGDVAHAASASTPVTETIS